MITVCSQTRYQKKRRDQTDGKAMFAHPRVHKRRGTITALPLYYSGHLLKKNSTEKFVKVNTAKKVMTFDDFQKFKRYYGELRGATLFLYRDDSQDTYTEKLDLEQLRSMELHSPYQKKIPTIFTLALHTEEVQLKMENADKGEKWRCYILTVVRKEIPSKLQLLPGQMVQLQEALAQERRRNPPAPCPPLPPRPPFLQSASSSSPKDPNTPSQVGRSRSRKCFVNVTRQEAEQMLESHPEHGDIIIRPSTLPNNYALTLRQQMPSGPVMKNYRVTATNSGFVIELEKAVTVSCLSQVLQYFLEKTDYRLQPYTGSQPYDTFIEALPAAKCVSIPSPAPKTVPKAQVAPMLWSQNKPPADEPEEGEYVDPDDRSLKLVQFEGELREVLKLRRECIYTVTGEKEVTSAH